MASRVLLTVISLVTFPGFWPALYGQRAKEPTLTEILQHLEANLHHYDTSLPSLFCEEHAVSRVWPGAPNQDSVTDSIFRLKRTSQANHTTALVESREIQRVDGKPATAANMDGPTLLSGAFEGALAVVSLNQSACMNYELQPIKRKHPTEPYIIRFATAPASRNSANCLLQENSKGRIFIDPASMQLMHLEATTPRHVIIPANSSARPVVGKRVLTIDYAPVLLDGENFWMPSAITLHNTSDSGTFHMIDWSFQATYRDYHKLEVTSRILPGSEKPMP